MMKNTINKITTNFMMKIIITKVTKTSKMDSKKCITSSFKTRMDLYQTVTTNNTRIKCSILKTSISSLNFKCRILTNSLLKDNLTNNITKLTTQIRMIIIFPKPSTHVITSSFTLLRTHKTSRW